ncbi:MAG TPA: isochorismatase family cysteine hydrolase [Spirochaetota bacterium]|mgnify:FL=1|nr:isochorismatase family cysteine hydrolase [Spirochaetota bacterium]HPQ54722.1 isochorismatase family cysteine hydrolase [Spirochaetota bacterium]
MNGETGLIIVDMQNYYLQSESSYSRYFDALYPGSLDYIHTRCRDLVVPNIARLITLFRENHEEILYLRLCGRKKDRSDLHRFFRETWEQGKQKGFDDVYPLSSDAMADVIADIAPAAGDHVFNKTTFSPFSSTGIMEQLRVLGITKLVFTGLATSQCVETTARDASDMGIDVIHIEDAQADYDESTHMASLYSSRGVCGGDIYSTGVFIESYFSER